MNRKTKVPSRYGHPMRRWAAFVIDSLLLSILFGISTIPLHSFYVALGPWTEVLGYSLALLYVMFYETQTRKGQTFGQLFLSIKVVDTDGKKITPLSSALRSYFSYPIALLIISQVVSYSLSQVLSVIFVCVIIADIYLILFNRKTRQSLLDIVTHSYVMRVHADVEPHSAIWRPHLAIGFGLATCVLIANFVFLRTETYADLNAISSTMQSRLEEQYNIQNVDVTLYKNIVFGSDAEQQAHTSLVITIPVGQRDFLQQDVFAQDVIAAQPREAIEALAIDSTVIILSYGYRIGFFSYNERKCLGC